MPVVLNGPIVTMDVTTPLQVNGSSSCTPFDTATVIDDAGATINTLTVRVLQAGCGSVVPPVLPAGVSYTDNGAGLYVFSGTMSPLQVQTILRGLNFNAAANAQGSTVLKTQIFLGLTDSNNRTLNSVYREVDVMPPPTDPTLLDFSGTSIDHTIMLTAGSLISQITGGSGNDILIGNGSSNVLNGGNGYNQMWGGPGNDTLIGGSDGDAFWYGNGDNHDSIRQQTYGSHDTVYLYNVDWNGYTAGRQNNNLRFVLPDGGTLTLLDWYLINPQWRVQGFIFGNGVVAAWNDGAGAEVNLSDSCYASNNIHKVQAFDMGPCVLRGSNGDDTLIGGVGTDSLTGGAGNDLLTGGGGFDMYWFGRGDGNDTITSDSRNSEDIVNLYNINAIDSVTLSFSGNDLILQMDSGATLTLKDWRLGGGHQLNRFQAGSFVWYLSEDGRSWVREWR